MLFKLVLGIVLSLAMAVFAKTAAAAPWQAHATDAVGVVRGA